MRLRLAAPALAAFAVASAAQAQATRQFDLVCTAKDETGAAETPRFSVDLDKKAWCARAEGQCVIATLFGIEGDVIVFERSQLETGSYDTSVNRKTGDYRSATTTAVPPVSTESRGRCAEAPFTAFGVPLNDGAKAARN